MLSTSSSPFLFQQTASAAELIGQQEPVSRGVDIITKRKKGIFLYDAPRTGKESVIRAILNEVNTLGNYIICEADLFNVRNEEDFERVVKQSIQYCYERLYKGTMMTFGLDLGLLTGRKMFDLIQNLASTSGYTILFYLKNFQNTLLFEENGGFKLDTIDKIWQRHTDVRYIVTGSSISRMKEISEKRKLFRLSTIRLELKRTESRDICEFIYHAFLNTGRVIETEESIAIYETVQDNFWYIKQMGNFCLSMPAGYITRKIVNQAREMLLSAHSARFCQIMQDLTVNQISLLKAIIDGIEKFSTAETLESYRLNSSANVFRVKEALEKKDIITFNEDESVRIIDPLFEYWLRHFYFTFPQI